MRRANLVQYHKHEVTGWKGGKKRERRGERETRKERGREGTNGSGRWEEGVEMRVRGDGRVEGGGEGKGLRAAGAF